MYFPMLMALNRRAPRTKSVFDRTSSRRYSSIDYDSNGFDDNESQLHNHDTNHRTHFVANHLNLLDSIFQQQQQQQYQQQYDDNFTVGNGQYDLTSAFDDDDNDNNDGNIHEYACFIFLRFSIVSLFISLLLFVNVSLLLSLMISKLFRFINPRRKTRVKSAITDRQSIRRSSSHTLQTIPKKEQEV
jgi:hypothetical protein